MSGIADRRPVAAANAPGSPDPRTPLTDWPKSTAAYARASKSLPSGVSTGLRASMKPFPLSFDRGDGSRLRDIDGNSYVDYVLGWGPVILGHSHPELVDAVTRQLHRGQTFGAGHALEYEVAESVCARVPGAERVLWTNTGSEAAVIALRLARAATGRRRYVKFGGHYHGWTDTMLHGYRPPLTGPASAGQLATAGRRRGAACVERRRCPRRDRPGAGRRHRGCLPGAGAVQLGRPRARRPASSTGSARCATPPASCWFSTRSSPASGWPGAAGPSGTPSPPTWCSSRRRSPAGSRWPPSPARRELLDLASRGVVHAGTYNGNPTVLAAAAAVLEVLARPGIYAAFEQRGGELAQGLREALARHGAVGTAHHVGPVVQCLPGAAGVADVRRASWPLTGRGTTR